MDWPPPLTENEVRALVVEGTTYALAHGLVYLPLDFDGTPMSAIHAPFTLLPTLFPKRLFDRAIDLQPVYNRLYSRIASHTALLDSVLGDQTGVGRVDHFTGRLWKGWKDLRDQGVIRQPLQLGIFRSDYLLHTSPESDLALKQVEFNTISSSFGSLAHEVSNMHRHLYNMWGPDRFGSPKHAIIPPNEALKQMSLALSKAHAAYGAAGASVLFVVQPRERNVFDQRLLEYDLLEAHGIRTIRLTLQEIAVRCSVDQDGTLKISGSTFDTPIEVSVVYFRAGYTPMDYLTDADYATRFQIEATRAIKCPSIPLQLAGSKKIQEYISHGTHLEDLLRSVGSEELWSLNANAVALIRATWMEMWGLDAEGGVQKALERANATVLKPQREGGGNNVYRNQIPAFLESLPTTEREAWIGMELINVPEMKNLMVKAGSGSAIVSSTVSELGVFGWSLFSDHHEIVDSGAGGWLLRTKGKESDEGGVAVGISVLDSPLLY